MLKLTKIKKDYKVAQGVVPALKGVSLEFRENEFVCILGQSGCGKTTLLNIIGGLDHYTSGDLVIQGKSTKDFNDRDWDVYRNHRIGFIFQSYNLIPHQTVLGNVELSLTIAGVSREERHQRAKEALRRVGLENELYKRPNQLSGGQMQRVAIARALVNNPAILLADEPTGALDSETSVQIMDLIKEIAHERLVIMVTHNPELAELYASRIVRLKDGEVESDSNPYHSVEEAVQTEHVPVETEEAGTQEKPKKRGKKPRAKMSFLTSLALSARNLLTKKGRTIITSVAGSIGIISVCLVLALSNGFNNYIKRTEEDMLSYYPISITESTYDMASIMTSFTSPKDMPDLEQLGDKIYVDSFLTGLAQGMSVKNNISDNYVSYIENMDRKLYSEIQYSYGASLTDNLFTTVTTGANVNATERKTMSLSTLKEFYINELNTYAPQYSSLVPFANFFGNIVNKMPGSSDLSDEHFGKYVLSQYEIVEGTFPTGASEAVLVVGKNNEITDLTLAQLGLLDEPEFLSLFKLGASAAKSDDYMTIAFKKALEQEYVLYQNNAVYTPNAQYNPMDKESYPFTYSGSRASLDVAEGEGTKIKVVGVLRLKDELTYGCLTTGLNITEAVIENYIAANKQSDIVKFINDEKNCIEREVEGVSYKIYLHTPAKKFDNYYSQTIDINQGAVSLQVAAAVDDSAIRYLGGVDKPNQISIYATDFDGKEELLNYLDQWNDWCTEGGGSYNGVALSDSDKVTYSDTVGLLMGMMQTMLNVITIVLVAFTAISLVVSSVMIGIITYVSVVERVKEIGVLRSLGARKQDIRNLFNAETFIIGLAAGLIGIVATYLLSLAVNAIIVALAGISGIAALPPLTAFIMVCVSVMLTLISGLIPAQAAAKKDPVIALRTE